MKNLLLRSTKMAMLFAALFGILTFSACSDDDEDPDGGGDTVIVEDGIYVVGAATAYGDAYNIKTLMSATRNEVLNEETEDARETLLNAFVALKGGMTFNISQVAGADRTSWGPGADWTAAQGGTNEEPNVEIQRGTIEPSEATFTVPADGLYHVVLDTKTGRGAVTPVEWGIIGQATPNGWSGDTKLDVPAFDAESMTFSLTGVELSKGEWKFRYSGGWKVEIDTTEDLGNGKKGVKVNSNFGGAVDALVPGGSNMTTDQSGVYDVSITWTAGEGHSAELTRTGDLPARDYSAVVVGIVGDGAVGSAWPANADDTDELGKTTPAKDGDVYTWAFNDIQLLAAGGFKLRTSGSWDDINLGYDANVIGGPNGDDIQESGGNMSVVADGTYDMVYTIDAANETSSLTFTKK
jgi:hypothetical protein